MGATVSAEVFLKRNDILPVNSWTIELVSDERISRCGYNAEALLFTETVEPGCFLKRLKIVEVEVSVVKRTEQVGLIDAHPFWGKLWATFSCLVWWES